MPAASLLRTLAAAAWAAAAASAPAAAPRLPRGAEPPPSAEVLLEALFEYPAVSYRGELSVVSYSGARARAHEARVSYAPVNRYRWEFLTPAGAV
ncbi:hypothetical protein EPO15_10270, partial [bacterium]